MFTIKNYLIVFSLFLISGCSSTSITRSQSLTYDNFEKEIFNYKLIKRKNITNKNYSYAKIIFQNTLKSIKNDNYTFEVTDYWNFTHVFALLNESKKKIELVFSKGINKDSIKICEYIAHVSKKTNRTISKTIPEKYHAFLKHCEPKNEININSTQKIKTNELKILMRTIKFNDQKFRKDLQTLKQNIDKQDVLDLNNQKIIDSLYNKHGKYIGKSFVGKDLSIVNWLVVQHSNLGMMKRYLPIINKAVKNQELTRGPLKMLIDRIYSIEYGCQIFGSQGGVELANDTIKKKVIEKYKLGNFE